MRTALSAADPCVQARREPEAGELADGMRSVHGTAMSGSKCG